MIMVNQIPAGVRSKRWNGCSAELVTKGDCCCWMKRMMSLDDVVLQEVRDTLQGDKAPYVSPIKERQNAAS